MKRIITILLSTLAAMGAHAVPVLGPLFSDNMVMQQETDAPIWGKARPGKTVTVSCSWNKAVATAKADKEGNWKAVVRTPKAGGPYTVTVSDGHAVTLRNVMVGEVWLCSGQSNMEYPVRGWAQVLDADREVAGAGHPGIRLLQIRKVAAERPQAAVAANTPSWQVSSPQSVPGFSAVAYFFARELSGRLHVPVGVIDATWGGSNIESWISGETLKLVPEFADSIARTGYHPWRNSQTALYNGMIHPPVPMAMRGVCWYQGEQNELRGHQYRDLFTLLIRDWRKQWQHDFPFYYVQLANFHERREEPVEALWAEVREAQDMALRLKHTGMAVAVDVGQGDNVHYPNKQEVARRLALIALAKTYGQDVVYSGPRYASYEVDNDKIVISFTHTDGGLAARNQALNSFTIAGADHRFHRAQARIEGDKVVVWSRQVKMPVAVRYAWQDNPDADLYNGAGLPAAPFRTDDWQLLSYGKLRGNSEY